MTLVEALDALAASRKAIATHFGYRRDFGGSDWCFCVHGFKNWDTKTFE